MPPKKKKSSRKGKKPAKKKRSFFWRFCRWMLILVLWAGIIGGAVILWFAKDLPDITQSAVFERHPARIIKAADGTVLARYGESKGGNVTVADLPPHLIHAVLATEDRRFYSHPGIDIIGITRAMAVNIIHGRFVQGGSTITQQLAKNLFLTPERSLGRKIQEALLALWMERTLSKDDILSAYMNRVYLGAGAYGMEAAAQLYFGKSAKDVNLLEAAMLAGLLKAPSRYSPHNDPERARARADVVLAAMHRAGYLEKSGMMPENMRLALPHKTAQAHRHTRYFTDWVLDGLDDLTGSPDLDIVIETTLDAPLQKHAHKRLRRAVDATDGLSQGAVLIMRPDGAVLSMVGGYDYGQSQFNRAVQARRPPGSAFKPVIYLAALEQGRRADDQILDAPITQGSYRPKNFAGKYYGTVGLEAALSKSMNTATVRLAQEVGIDTVMRTAQKLGIIAPLPRDLSLALGSAGVSMLEMGTAYAVPANGGRRIYPYAITRITTKEGRVLFERKSPQHYQPVIRPASAHTLSRMMERVLTDDGTGRAAGLPFPASGKTGTSQDSRDAWFAGYTDRIVSVVWLGNDDNSPVKGLTGGGLPAQIWHDIMLYGNGRHDPVVLAAPQEEETHKGISGFLEQLLSAETPPRPSRRDDYSHLND